MADIELVIKVPEHCFEELKCVELNESNEGVVFHAIKCILNGTPLPKGHGELIDADTLKKDDEVTKWITLNPVRTGKMLKAFSELFIKKIDATKTIIEADKESEE